MAITKKHRENTGSYRFSIGEFDVTVLNDGHIRGSYNLLVDTASHAPEKTANIAFDHGSPRICVNSFLIQSAKTTWLVDAGCGTTYGPELGFLELELSRIGVRPVDIDVLLMTHLHGDHANGLLDREKRPLYEHATLLVSREEHAFWLDDARVGAAPPRAVGSLAGNRAVLAAYGSRVQLFEAGDVLPGLEAVSLPGHTPGHMGWLLASQDERLLIWGDIVHLPAVQFADPEAGVVFDVDLETARATRQEILARVAAERLLVGGMHLDFPAVGHVVHLGEGYHFVPAQWLRADRAERPS